MVLAATVVLLVTGVATITGVIGALIDRSAADHPRFHEQGDR